MCRSLHTDPDSIRATRSLRRFRTPARWPRVKARPARPGRAHPASPAEITRLLLACGDICRCGIEAIDLLPGRPDPTRIRLGALKVPGRIVLYDQPLSPWLIPGHLDYHEERRMRGAGALIERVSGGIRVEWPGDTLRDFMLFEVLMHEIGHHVLQHYAGKRSVRVARTRDHEAFASRFAARCRRRYAQGEA